MLHLASSKQEVCRVQHEQSYAEAREEQKLYSHHLILATPSELAELSSSQSSECGPLPLSMPPRPRREENKAPPSIKQPLLSYAGKALNRSSPAKIPMCISVKVSSDMRNEVEAGDNLVSQDRHGYIWSPSSPDFDVYSHSEAAEIPPPKSSSVCTMTTLSESESAVSMDHIMKTPPFSLVQQCRAVEPKYTSGAHMALSTARSTNTCAAGAKRVGFALSRRKPLRHEDGYMYAKHGEEHSPSNDKNAPTFDAKEDALLQSPKTPLVEHYASHHHSAAMPRSPPRVGYKFPNHEVPDMEDAMPSMPTLSNNYLR